MTLAGGQPQPRRTGSKSALRHNGEWGLKVFGSSPSGKKTPEKGGVGGIDKGKKRFQCRSEKSQIIVGLLDHLAMPPGPKAKIAIHTRMLQG